LSSTSNRAAMSDRSDEARLALYDGHVRTKSDFDVGSQLDVRESAPIVVTGVSEIRVGDDVAGWLYRADDGVDYVQFVGDDGLATIDPDRSLASQLPDDATCVAVGSDERDVPDAPAASDAVAPMDDAPDRIESIEEIEAVEDLTFRDSPARVGDMIPDGCGGKTPVTDIAAIEDSRGSDVGWAYRGGDGRDYFEPSPTSGRAATVGVAMEVTAWRGGAEDHSGVRGFQAGDVRPGDTVHAMNGTSTWLDVTKLGYTPSQTMTLSEGAQATGKIVAVTESDVLQNAGRGVVYVHPRDAFYDAVPEPGSQATIANQNGRFAAMVDLERAPERELGIERGARGA
jgi:hypothetical protein